MSQKIRRRSSVDRLLSEINAGTMECRLCLGSAPADSSVSIFGDPHPERLEQRIRTCCQVQVKRDDGLPDTVCLSCNTNLESLISFRKACFRSNETSQLRLDNCLKIKTEEVLLKDEDYSQQHQNEVVQKESLIYSSLNDDDEGPMPKVTKNRPNKINELLAQACTILSRPIVESPQTSFDLMYASWIESLKGLNPKLKFDTAHAINNIICEAQAKNLYYT
ncbi:uncharacterized protein LOC143919148 [Arctopsyche grandis]|uniref:uncharacterized protein LOC143919147 n=1 Tax=Arctopsyche grandis TaxID=121162 RepID=UPI00406D9681